MNTKAFTLVELLGVIIITMLLSLLVVPAVLNIVKRSKETIYQKQINTILTAAYDFSLKNLTYLPENGQSNYVTVGELKYAGLLDFNIKNPNTSENFDDSLVIKIHNSGTNKNYNKEVSKQFGNYLYTIEFDKLELTNFKPEISIQGYQKNSDNNYIIVLNLNDNFVLPSYTAKSYNNVDITENVKTYITSNDDIVSSVNANESGIYKIHYVVIDDEGYSNSIVLNIIIADTEVPKILLPPNSKISKATSTFDLMKNVTCEDNSGFCDIITDGTINFGIPGKYIIEYTATDPSGNTSVSKRVITIE